MSSNFTKSLAPYDQEIIDIADYVLNYEIKSELAYQTAWHCFIDTIGCGLEALEYEACTKLLGPVVEGLKIENGARVPGTSFQLDPVTAAFNIGAAIRWLDYNDTWLAAEWGHPSDNLGAIPSSRLLLCPTGYSTTTSSNTVPSLKVIVIALAIDRFCGSW